MDQMEKAAAKRLTSRCLALGEGAIVELSRITTGAGGKAVEAQPKFGSRGGEPFEFRIGNLT